MIKNSAIVFLYLFTSAVAFTQQSHIVKKGDTLWDLSGYFLDNPFFWPQIYKANVHQIRDPHWIYPGQEFIIPGLMSQRTAEDMEMIPRESAQLSLKEAAAPGGELATPAEEQKPGDFPAAGEDAGFWKEDIAVVPPALVYRAGYIIKEPPRWGEIIDVEEAEPRSILSHHEVLVNRGAKDVVAQEQLFAVLRIGKGVKHPRDRRYLGKIVYAVGILRATSVEESSFRALVEACYEHIRLGDIVIPLQQPDIPSEGGLLETERELLGIIVAKLTNQPRFWPRDIVYIDKGKVDGIHPGDVFEVYREGKKIKGAVEPTRVVGELRVLRVEDETSSAIITSIDNRLDLKVGESIRLKKEAI